MEFDVIIEKVEFYDGREFKGTNWKSKMQVIYTKVGYLFIDNDIGKCFGVSNIKWEGINWKQYIGQKVKIMVVNCVGKEITSSKFKPVYKIDDLKNKIGNHYENCPNHNWAYPLFKLGKPDKKK
jgi:hypothetical protein